MRLIIKLVPKCKHNCKGEFIPQSKNTCEIQIALNQNKTVSEFAQTLLHELFHFWVTILQTYGLKESIKKEHQFIDEIMPITLKCLIKYLG